MFAWTTIILKMREERPLKSKEANFRSNWHMIATPQHLGIAKNYTMCHAFTFIIILFINRPVARCCSVFDWKRSRRAVLANIDDYLSGKPNPMFTISREEVSQSLIILIDDNLHLRSMRKEFYQLARKCEQIMTFLHLYVRLFLFPRHFYTMSIYLFDC